MVLLDPTLLPLCLISLLQMTADIVRLSFQRMENEKDDRSHIERPDFAPVGADTQTTGKVEETDSILSALTQLGAFRLGCGRAFTAILEGDVCRVIAEATPQSSTLDNENLDPYSLTGTVTVGLGGCKRQDHDGSFYDENCVIRDTKEKALDLEENPLLERSQARFYAEVPLHDCSGKLIGTYGVVDKDPRTSFSSQDLTDLYDIAKTIAVHLDTVVARRRDAQSKLQLKALVAMSKGPHELQTTDWEPRQSTSRSGSVSRRSSVPYLESLNHSHTAAQPPGPSPSITHGAAFWDGPPSEGRELPPNGHPRHARKSSGEQRNMVIVPEERLISPGVASIYAKAASLLQAGMDLDGVLFVDTPRVSSRLNSRRSSCASFCEVEGNAKSANYANSTNSNRRTSAKLCDTLGSAFSERYLMESRARSPLTIDEELLHELFMAFPHGHVFHSVQAANRTEPINQTVGGGLWRAIPDASPLIFLPIWSYDKSKWLAATIIWSCNSQRAFEDDDLYYLKASTDMISSGIAQIDQSAVEKSKSDLLSSMSHELRSPLHGMLANSELLQSTDLDPAQRDMVKMVETCGETLLDTMNCLLDFAKINNLTHAHKGSINTSAHINSLTTEFDLGSLVEHVADSVYAGHRRIVQASKRSCCRLPEEDELGQTGVGTERNTNALSVIVSIEDETDWTIRSISGAWRRIIMNILGNALKFTRSGLIEVAVHRKRRRRHARISDFAHLRITDTGCGISQSYFDSKLFTPFSQESVLTDGVGLGLSITKQLVEYLGGHIQVESDLGAGTQVDIYVPVDFVEKCSLADGDNQGREAPLRVCLVGLDPHVDSHDTSQRLSSDTKRKLAIQSTISGLILRQPGWKVSSADPTDTLSGDVALIEESTLRIATTVETCKSKFQSMLVLGDSTASALQPFDIDGVDVAYVPQPYGPQKVIQALQSIAKSEAIVTSADCRLTPIPISTMAARNQPLSKVYDKPEGLDSPLAVRQSVSDYASLRPDRLSEKPIHVLIVDDNDINLKILSTFLRKIGCTFETASDGLSALEKFKQCTRKVDYVLMDISMPVMDGITSSSKIREYEEENEIPRSAIMAVTGVASSETQEQAFAAGIDDYLVKPLSLHDLKRILSVP
ncbi:sensor histidine kinase/response regulator [Aspergillus carlsbadensis]|nr:sensor histidine kinase/response regulator [Aspergillus carlsbadensis]